MDFYNIKQRRTSPEEDFPLEQVLQSSSYSSPVELHLSQRYIPDPAPVDLRSASGSEGYFSPDELVRTIQEATTVAAKSGFTEASLLELVQAEWRQQRPQQQQQQHHKVKRLQHHHQHQHNTVKRRRGPQLNQRSAQPQRQYHLELQQPQPQPHHQQSNLRQTYHYQLREQQPYQQPLYQQELYQQQPYHPQPYEQQSEGQNLQPYHQQQEQHFQPQRLHVVTNVQMPANYSSDSCEEKSAPSLHSSPDSSDGCSPPWMTPRVVTRWFCLNSEPAYERVPPTAAFEYAGSVPAVNAGMPSMVSESIPSSHPTSFACDGGLLGQGGYLPGWAPMQPTRVTEVQPSMIKEEMLYPDDSASAPAGTQGRPDLQTHTYCAGHLSSPPLKSEPISAPTAGDGSPFLHQGAFGFPPPTLDAAPSYDDYDDYDAYNVEEDQANQAASSAPAPSRTHTRPVAAKRGPFKDNEQRVKTAMTRKMGSCVRCRMQRIRCVLDENNTSGPCVACRKLFEHRTNVYRPSCARLKITDMKIFKPGQVRGFEWTRRWKDSVVDDIDTWESVETRMIQVTEGYTGKAITLWVRKFRPQEGDKLDRTWVSANGERRKVAVPPYAIVDMEAAALNIRQYIRGGLESCFNALLGSQNQLVYKTYALALDRARDQNPFVTLAEKNLLISTLDLWFAIRLSTKSFEIVGQDSLGMPDHIIDDQSSDQYGKVPIPPVLGAQLDSILLHQVLAQYRRTVLEDLSKMVQEKRPSTWLTIYLATFILLHNAALITKHDASYAKKHGMNRRFARPQEVKEYNVAAQTVLHYYHYCNKGIYPFTAECKDYELQALAELDGRGIEMVHYTRQFAAEQSKQAQTKMALLRSANAHPLCEQKNTGKGCGLEMSMKMSTTI